MVYIKNNATIILVPGKKLRDPKETDVTEWWRDYPCRHEGTTCSFYGYSVVLACEACNRTAMFMFNPGNGTFDAEAGHLDGFMSVFRPMGQGKLATFVKGAAGIFFMPDPPGDPEGSHPERDARHFGEVASAFKRHGIDLESIARKVSSRGTTTTCSCCGHERG